MIDQKSDFKGIGRFILVTPCFNYLILATSLEHYNKVKFIWCFCVNKFLQETLSALLRFSFKLRLNDYLEKDFCHCFLYFYQNDFILKSQDFWVLIVVLTKIVHGID